MATAKRTTLGGGPRDVAMLEAAAAREATATVAAVAVADRNKPKAPRRPKHQQATQTGCATDTRANEGQAPEDARAQTALSRTSAGCAAQSVGQNRQRHSVGGVITLF